MNLFKTLFLPLGLCLAIMSSLLMPSFGKWVSNQNCYSYLVSIIFLLNGFDFKTKDWSFTKDKLLKVFYFSFISLAVAPALAYFIANVFQLSFGWMLGFYVMACVPTTLSSGIVITSEAKGDKNTAVILTLVMSFLGVFILPFSLGFLLQNNESLSIQPISMMYDLCCTVLLPFLLGLVIKKVLKTSYTVGNYIPSSIVILVVYSSASKSNQILLETTLSSFLLISIASMCLHFSLMVLIHASNKIFKTSRTESIAYLICGSQKTLPISIAVLSTFNNTTSDALIMCITLHFIQLIFDSFLATKLKYHGNVS